MSLQNNPISQHKVPAHRVHPVIRFVDGLGAVDTPASHKIGGGGFALAFAGQGFEWLPALRRMLAQGVQPQVQRVIAEANLLLEPLAMELAPLRPAGFSPIEWAQQPDGSPVDVDLAAAAVSVPGILLAQMATVFSLEVQGLPVNKATSVIGHSQGELAVEWLRDRSRGAHTLAIAQLIGAAITRVGLMEGLIAPKRLGMVPAVGEAPMVLINKVGKKRLKAAVRKVNEGLPAGTPEVVIGLRNARDTYVIVGRPALLADVAKILAQEAAAEQKQVAARRRGGAPFNPEIAALPVQTAFHHPRMQAAVELVVQWADKAGIDVDSARELAEVVMVRPVDWRSAVLGVADQGVSWILDLGPTGGLVERTTSIVAGRGIGVVNVSTSTGQGVLFDPGLAPVKPQAWSEFLPRVEERAGKKRLVTRFTELTGNSAVMLPGMTPTTVDPAIVAAAANAGHWAELAGGGQVTPEVFESNLQRLEELLEPGVNAQFNTMFLNPELWRMHVEGQRLVPKARMNGAPINGLCISAGMPPKDEAVALIRKLRAEGLSWIALKPGAVRHIQKALEVADALPDIPLIFQVEGGQAGGHHSWEDLDELLLATYGEIRKRDNVVLAVGGGIATPADGAKYLTGTWAEAYDMPLMPVDAIMLGTVTMATKESTASRSVKEALVATPGFDDGWVAQGGVRGGVTSGLSQLGADIYEIENSYTKAGRLLDEVAGDAQAVADRHEDIIAAIAPTAKPYFGDPAEMTYLAWLNRYLELSGPTTEFPEWVDITWAQRFADMVARAEARLHPQDHGQFQPILQPDVIFAAPDTAVETLAATYPQAAELQLNASDVAWFISRVSAPGKPANFVPVIDADVRRRWRSDSLWQAHDERYTADQVGIIPGPRAVAGITTIDEPVAELFARFLDEAIAQVEEDRPAEASATTLTERILAARDTYWAGHHQPAITAALGQWTIDAEDPAKALSSMGAELRAVDEEHARLSIPLPPLAEKLQLTITVPSGSPASVAPQITGEDAEAAMVELTRIAAGGKLAEVDEDGIARWTTELTSADIADYTTVTSGATNLEGLAPDVVVGKAWPAIFAVLSTTHAHGETFSAVEGMLRLVHMDHHLAATTAAITPGALDVEAHVVDLSDTPAGRVITVEASLKRAGETLVQLRERFIVRGRVGHATLRPAQHSTHEKPTAASFRAQLSVTAPQNMLPFAVASGDHNPIHQSGTAAALAGLETGVIVHGMWTSAIAQRAAAFDGADILEWTAELQAPVLPGATIDLTVTKTGVDGRPGYGEIRTVTATVEGTPVLSATAVLRAPITFYGFPGQGVQSPGMGMESRRNSAAARDIWARADQHTRAKLGFSIVEIVTNNPAEVVVKGERFHHPDGVLYLTQFTQVAMATLGVAQIAELEEAQVLNQQAYFAGHSVGEYNALCAYGRVLTLEAVLEIVYQRGLTMDRLVERDAEGNSNYGLAALRPNKIGLDSAEVFNYVQKIADETGEFLQIVNYNIDGVQYAVAGTRAGLAALAADAEHRAPGQRAFIPIPGIDVPFHSTLLRNGVDAFRCHLEDLFPADIDLNVMEGRYIPNLVARPFELSDDFIAAMQEVVDSERLDEVLADPQRYTQNRAATGRTILIELLAWQFASPVRWIETQDLLLRSREQGGLGAEQFVEVGVGTAPTLANMMGQTLRLAKYADHPIEVLNVERDRAKVYSEDAEHAPEPAALPVETAAPAQATAAAVVEEAQGAPNAPAAPAASTERPADITFSPSDATTMLLALWTKVRPDQMSPADTIEVLVEGVSSRRNQLLLDLGNEFGLGAIDGAADAPLDNLRATVTAMARNYTAFGPVLKEAMADALRRLTGPAGSKPSAISDRVRDTWQLGQGWIDHVNAAVVLGTREGASLRGGELATLPPASTSAQLNEAIDAAVQQVAAAHGVTVALPAAGGGAAGVVDSAALNEFAAQVTGEDGVLAATARDLLRRLGLENTPVAEHADNNDDLVDLVAAELGSDWARQVAPRFDAKKVVLLDDRWASAREDVIRAAHGLVDPTSLNVTGGGEEVAKLAESAGFAALAAEARDTTPGVYADDIAVVTGASPRSIAAGVVAQLLQGEATVVATTSHLSHERVEFYKELYRTHARGNAALWIVPFNAASFQDIDALVQWIGSEQSTTVGAEKKITKPALVPTLLFPFAAPQVHGTMADAGAHAESQMRLLLWSVEKTIAGLGKLGADTHVGQRLHVVLPGSPNRGLFGGDGAYGEAKAALDAILNRWKVETVWSQHTSLVHALIGWVRGTGLMGGNDPLVSAVEARGVRTYNTDEMAALLLGCVTPEVRAAAATAPVQRDFTGGLGDTQLDMAELTAEAAAAVSENSNASAKTSVMARALPSIRTALPVDHTAFAPGSVTQKLEEMVVLVGAAELSPLGSSRTRFDVELGGDLSAAGVIELAWSMGLISWDSESRVPGWVTAEGEAIAEEDIFDTYHDEVLGRIGVRRYHDAFTVVDNLAPELTAIYLDEDLRFTVDDHATALTFQKSDPTHTVIEAAAGDSGEWVVTRKAGAEIRVPRRMAMTRFVGGQIPEGFDPARYGVPADMIDSMDTVAVWDLVCTVDAFLSSGFTPAELLAAVHPAKVSSTQGTGMGGMDSLRAIYVERLLDEPRASDVLQEALPNVIAAHVMQDYVGGYGAMVHPVAACATAAVSLEEGVDKIRLGKADFVVAGGFDALGIEGITGFGNMAATADSTEMEAKGIEHRFFSRANDRRRGGFIESEGGGTLLLARGSLAADLGLPVLGVVGFAESFADGAHTSIPAPGLGALAAAQGGTKSRLAAGLRELGVEADDIAVVSKHDTSTNANDPNESELHERIATALQRSEGNPFYVISQKTLTGHAKGGAAAFQLVGLTQVLRTGMLPANRSLDCVDPALRHHPHMVWLRKPLHVGTATLKAGLVTSLGFGHVSALVALVHPGAFYAAVAEQRSAAEAITWAQEAHQREVVGLRRLDSAMHGGEALYQRPANRNLGAASSEVQKEREAAMLLDPQARFRGGRLQ